MAAKKSTKKTPINDKKAVKKPKKSKNGDKRFADRAKVFILENNLHIAFAIALLLAFLYYYKGLFLAATVNGEPITRFRVINELEAEAGQDTIESLVTRKLILQEAEERGVSVSEQAIDQEIDEYRTALTEQGQDLEGVLAFQGLNMDEFREQVRFQLMIEKMFSDGVEVTDEQIATYIEENESFLPEDLEGEELNEQVREQLVQEMISERFQEWLGSARQEANVRYFVDYAN